MTSSFPIPLSRSLSLSLAGYTASSLGVLKHSSPHPICNICLQLETPSMFLWSVPLKWILSLCQCYIYSSVSVKSSIFTRAPHSSLLFYWRKIKHKASCLRNALILFSWECVLDRRNANHFKISRACHVGILIRMTGFRAIQIKWRYFYKNRPNCSESHSF
jgi:hypothetical protein